MPDDKPPTWDRSADLDQIRATYGRYEATGRERLWDPGNRGYARLSRALKERILDVLRRSLPPDPGARVLDLGCGTGQLLEQVRATGMSPTWTGVDVRPGVVDDARAAHADVDFLVASADDLPLPDASVDVVVAQLLFSSLPSTGLERAVVAEIRRVLRPRGWLVWSDLRYDNPTNRAVHGMGRHRLRDLFGGWTIEVEAVGLLPPVARRLGPLTPVAYPILSAASPLRSHLVGRMQPPPAA